MFTRGIFVIFLSEKKTHERIPKCSYLLFTPTPPQHNKQYIYSRIKKIKSGVR